jgi:ABC-type nitrate/sulfonate/bicarbonate transport system substrate-binding protein
MLFSCGKATNEKALRYIGFKIYDPAYISQEKGLFRNHDLDVEIIELIAGGPTAIQAITGGSAEICVSSYMAVINARAQGLPVMAISDIQSSIGDQALEEFFVRKDSGINSIVDFKGKKAAINLVKSSFHYTWLMALAAAGMTESDVEFVILPFDQQELALINGHVDAIGVMQPYVHHAKDNEGLKVLFTALDVFGERQFTAHVINSEWAEKNQEKTARFVAAIAEAAAWIETNQEEAKEIMAKYTGVPPGDIDDYHFQKNAAIVLADAQYWLDYMRGTGEVTANWLQAGDFASNRYNPNER